MINKIFYLGFLSDAPILVAIFMSVYPKFQNEVIFYISVLIGFVSLIVSVNLIKRLNIEHFISSFSVLDMIGYLLYILFMYGFVIYLFFTDRLYMKWVILVYILLYFLLTIYSTSQNEESV
ncbi:MAG: hypothetical protein GXO22_02550 [Aquificae bacterium]|nr:hypothetical protein [Aquificota bacterium]